MASSPQPFLELSSLITDASAEATTDAAGDEMGSQAPPPCLTFWSCMMHSEMVTRAGGIEEASLAAQERHKQYKGLFFLPPHLQRGVKMVLESKQGRSIIKGESTKR